MTVAQVIGRLGNAGNTNAAHLHFHICDSMDYIFCNGQPYAFASYRAAKPFGSNPIRFNSSPVYVNYADSMPKDLDQVRWG